MADAVSALPRSRYDRTRSQPESSDRLGRELTGSDPVDPKELRRRLEAWLIDEQIRRHYRLPRLVKRVQTSSNASPCADESETSLSITSNASPRECQQPIPLAYSQDMFARSLKFHELQKHHEAAYKQPERNREANIGIATTTDFPVSVDRRSGPAPRSVVHQDIQRPYEGTRKATLLSRPPAEFLDDRGNSKRHKQRPKSLPYMPRYAGRSMVLTATPNPVKRESVHVLSHQVLDAYQRPSLLHDLETPSRLNSTFAEGFSSPDASTHIRASQTEYGHSAAPQDSGDGSDAQPRHPTIGQSALLEPRPKGARPKTWTPRTLVNAIKARNETHDDLMRRNYFQATKVMRDAAPFERNRTVPPRQFPSPSEAVAGSIEDNVDSLATRRGSKRRTTTSEDLLANAETKRKYCNAPVQPVGQIPVIFEPGERRPAAGDWVQDSSDDESKEGLIRRVSSRLSWRRKMGYVQQNAEEQKAKDVLRKAKKQEDLRANELHMRQKARKSSGRAQGKVKEWERLPSQRRLQVDANLTEQAGSKAAEESRHENTQPVVPAAINPPSPRLELATRSAGNALLPEPTESLDKSMDAPLALPLNLSPTLIEPVVAGALERKVTVTSKDRFYQQALQLHSASSMRTGPAVATSPRPIIRTQTAPLLPCPRNDLANLPSQRFVVTRNLPTPPLGSLTSKAIGGTKHAVNNGEDELLSLAELHARRTTSSGSSSATKMCFKAPVPQNKGDNGDSHKQHHIHVPSSLKHSNEDGHALARLGASDKAVSMMDLRETKPRRDKRKSRWNFWRKD